MVGNASPGRWMAIAFAVAVILGIALGYWVFDSLS